MFGRPTPTKQTRWPSSARAAATIIISDFEKAAVMSHGPRLARSMHPTTITDNEAMDFVRPVRVIHQGAIQPRSEVASVHGAH